MWSEQSVSCCVAGSVCCCLRSERRCQGEASRGMHTIIRQAACGAPPCTCMHACFFESAAAKCTGSESRAMCSVSVLCGKRGASRFLLRCMGLVTLEAYPSAGAWQSSHASPCATVATNKCAQPPLARPPPKAGISLWLFFFVACLAASPKKRRIADVKPCRAPAQHACISISALTRQCETEAALPAGTQAERKEVNGCGHEHTLACTPAPHTHKQNTPLAVVINARPHTKCGTNAGSSGCAGGSGGGGRRSACARKHALRSHTGPSVARAWQHRPTLCA